MPTTGYEVLKAVLKAVGGPATVGVVLSAAVVARLAVGDGGRPRAWAVRMAWAGFAVFLGWQIAVLAVLPAGNADLGVFYRAGREAAAGQDPYLFVGDRVFLNPLPALGAFRVVSALPYVVVENAWSLLTAGLTLALVPLSNRLLARDHDPDDPGDAPPALPFDVAALLGAAVLTSNASLRGHRWGQLGAVAAVAVLLALLARQRGRPLLAGACLAVAAFKPATVLPFLGLFLRKADRPAWLGLAAVSLGLGLVAAPPSEWPTLTRHNLAQIGDSGGPGKINDYDFPRDISADLVAFNQLFHRFGLRDRRAISGLQWAATAAVLAGLFAVRNRRPFSAVAALTAAGSMLVLYHRTYDAVILALPLAFGASMALRATGRRRALAVASVALLLGAIDQPREAMIELTRWSLDKGLTGRLIQVVVLPYATYFLLLAVLCLALCAFPAREVPAPAAGA